MAFVGLCVSTCGVSQYAICHAVGARRPYRHARIAFKVGFYCSAAPSTHVPSVRVRTRTKQQLGKARPARAIVPQQRDIKNMNIFVTLYTVIYCNSIPYMKIGYTCVQQVEVPQCLVKALGITIRLLTKIDHSIAN